MGQCCANKQTNVDRPHKQNKNIEDKQMLKVEIEVLKKDFCVQIGYNRRAVKNYSDLVKGPDVNLGTRSESQPTHPDEELTDQVS